MKRILVVFHSQQYGNTKILAEAVAEGIRRAGAEARLVNAHEQRLALADYLDADAIALGTPDYYSYPAGTIKTLFDDLYLWDKEGHAIKGKTAILAPHYEKTLMAWHRNFQKAWDRLKDQHDEKFKRMWEYYLLSCAGAFRARQIQLWQIVFTKNGTSQPLCRI